MNLFAAPRQLPHTDERAVVFRMLIHSKKTKITTPRMPHKIYALLAEALTELPRQFVCVVERLSDTQGRYLKVCIERLSRSSPVPMHDDKITLQLQLKFMRWFLKGRLLSSR